MRKLKLVLCAGVAVALGATPAFAEPPPQAHEPPPRAQEARCAKQEGKQHAPAFCEEEGGGIIT